jgi:hypothetical protein
MAEPNVLVVLQDALHEPLRRELAGRAGPVGRVRVVAPAHVGALEWLASDEDEAHADAAARALAAEWSIVEHADVEGGEVGESDPVLAVEDALRTFPADEILLVAAPDESGDLETSLRSFGLPVVRVPASARSPESAPVRRQARALASGRSAATPFVAFAGVNLAMLALAALVALAVVLVLVLR